MYSEQETGGQRKELPLVRWYGFTKDRFRIFLFLGFFFLGKTIKKKKNPVRSQNETKQSVKSCLKSHAKYWMPQACILPGTEVYRTLGLEQHSSPTQNTNIQIYDLFFVHYLQCVADKR